MISLGHGCAGGEAQARGSLSFALHTIAQTLTWLLRAINNSTLTDMDGAWL